MKYVHKCATDLFSNRRIYPKDQPVIDDFYCKSVLHSSEVCFSFFAETHGNLRTFAFRFSQGCSAMLQKVRYEWLIMPLQFLY